ncbi:DNA-binding domain-containing protein [Nonomuraea sp. NPDC050547]|uniref:DNA-binding domain-containing protein n=1 Tax=Nonomuraea sp. NPDC050547 TaxID=3364368 RepID=UPI00378E4472
MVDGVAGVTELGVLTASAEDWLVAVRRAEVIGRLAREPRVRSAEAAEAAVEPGISRRQVYGLLKRWRTGSGVASDLLPRRLSGGRDRGQGRMPEEVEALLLEVIRSRYLTRQRRTVSTVYKEVVQQCRLRGLAVPSRGTLERRIGQLDPLASVTARQGAEAPVIEGLLEQVQIAVVLALPSRRPLQHVGHAVAGTQRRLGLDPGAQRVRRRPGLGSACRALGRPRRTDRHYLGWTCG